MILFVKYDESGAILTVSDGPFDDAEKIEIQDDSYINDPNSIYNYKIVNHQFAHIEEEEKKQLYPFLYPDELKIEKEKQSDQLTEMLKASSTKTYLDNLADEQASLIPFCYDAWDDFNEGFSIEKDSRVQSIGKLFKAKNTVLKTELRPENDPDNFDDLTGSPSTGSEEDVITLPDNVMTQGYSYIYGKFYKKNGNEKVYQCYRGGLSEEVANSMFGQVQVLYYYPDALLGIYFREKV
jgi:hypothetical protein